MGSRPRIVIASPHVPECTLIADWLASEGFEPVRVSSLERATDEIRSRAFDLLVADVTFAFRQGLPVIGAARARNPKMPIVVIGEPDAAAEAQALGRGAMYLPRPVDRASLVCTVAMAVVETRPVRRSLRKPVNRFDAVVEGVPSHIIDVSNEGLRLEIPRGRKSTPPPPFFNVRVPMIGVALMVRRMWTASAPEPDRDASWYGGELSRNPRKVEQAWLSLVDAIPGAGASLEHLH
jgi:ActR/RegA family two-component response regulator